ncbi:hypothetical protein ACI394_30290, partial [Klebsiella pneumoniae]|uniref:hypothetical protein n=1 Tax=Klebsiella pneumoniae TaxID=573 RepID=UPI00385375E7
LAKASDQNISLPHVADSKAIGGKGVQATIDDRSVFLGSPAAVAELSSLTSEQIARIAALNDEGKTVSLLSIGHELA